MLGDADEIVFALWHGPAGVEIVGDAAGAIRFRAEADIAVHFAVIGRQQAPGLFLRIGNGDADAAGRIARRQIGGGRLRGTGCRVGRQRALDLAVGHQIGVGDRGAEIGAEIEGLPVNLAVADVDRHRDRIEDQAVEIIRRELHRGLEAGWRRIGAGVVVENDVHEALER
jgi:hypothetical protein